MKAVLDINDIIVRSFTEKLTEEERLFLEKWKSESSENISEYHDYEAIWAESGKLAGTLEIDLPGSMERIRRRTGIDRFIFIRKFFLLQAAAVLVLAVLITSVYSWIQEKKDIPGEELMAYQEVKAPYGTQTRLELHDGTVVFLNSGSILKFPVAFRENVSRKVWLTGEGFFEVKKEDNKTPFVVDAGSLLINVTGTRFNVDAYPGNQEISVALAEGEVILQKEKQSEITDLTTLKPREVAYWDSAGNKMNIIQHTDLEKYIAWTEGKIIFSDDPIRTVIQKLENWYNVDIEIADSRVMKYRFTGVFFDEPLNQVLHLLSISSGMEYIVIPAVKQNDNSYSKRKIILKSKRT